MAKNRYFMFAIVFLFQIFLLTIIIYQNGRQRILLERLQEKIIIEDSRGNLFNEKLNSIESNLLRVSSQMYRLQVENTDKSKK